MKNRGIAIVLALFLGWIGVHRFYLGQIGRGFLFLLFSWTGIPAIIALIDVIRYVVMGQRAFHERFSSMPLPHKPQ